MVIRADARAMGAVTAHDARVAPRWQASTAAQRAQAGVGTSECISYKLDEHGNKVEPHIFRAKRERGTRRQRRQHNVQHEARMTLLRLAGNNSEVD